MTNLESNPIVRRGEEEIGHTGEVEAIVEEETAIPARKRKVTIFDVERFYEGDTHASEMSLEAYQPGSSRMRDPRLEQRYREDNPYSRG